MALQKIGRRRVAVAIALLLLELAPAKSWAWGRQGHRLTALVAEQYLTPETRAAVAELLHKQTLADVASWADDYRTDHPETGKWHFVDIPGDAVSFDRMRDCPASASDPKSPWRDCVTDRILYFEGELGDTSLPPQERAMALKFLVHLIGDVHQPFHAIGDARGGNDIPVNFMGSIQCGTYHCNLHGVWDESLIEHEGLSEKKYLEHLLQLIQVNDWQRMSGGSPGTWADVSHHYAVNAELPPNALVTHDYVTEESKIVDAQLALGGLRLARVLNRILGSDGPANPQRQELPKSAISSPLP